MSQRPEDVLAALPPQFRFRPRPITDPIDMEFLIQNVTDPKLRNQLMAVRLETTAKILNNIAEGAQQAASMLKG